MRGMTWVLSLALWSGLPSCRRAPQSSLRQEWRPRPVSDFGAVVARVGNTPIHAAEVTTLSDAGKTTPAHALNELIRFSLLAERARSAGIELDFSDDAVRARLVQRLLEREFEPRATAESMPEAELRAVYERARSHWVHSRLVDVGVISIYSDAMTKAEARERARTTALELAAAVEKAAPRTADDLVALAKDPFWSSRKVRATRTLHSDREPFSPVLGAAVQKLHRIGERTALVHDPLGYHIAMYAGERPPENVPFEVARKEIREQLHKAWQNQAFIRFATEKSGGRTIEVHPEALVATPQGG